MIPLLAILSRSTPLVETPITLAADLKSPVVASDENCNPGEAAVPFADLKGTSDETAVPEISMLLVPPVVKPITFDALRNIPVLFEEVNVNDGAAAVPSLLRIGCALVVAPDPTVIRAIPFALSAKVLLFTENIPVVNPPSKTSAGLAAVGAEGKTKTPVIVSPASRTLSAARVGFGYVPARAPPAAPVGGAPPPASVGLGYVPARAPPAAPVGAAPPPARVGLGYVPARAPPAGPVGAPPPPPPELAALPGVSAASAGSEVKNKRPKAK